MELGQRPAEQARGAAGPVCCSALPSQLLCHPSALPCLRWHDRPVAAAASSLPDAVSITLGSPPCSVRRRGAPYPPGFAPQRQSGAAAARTAAALQAAADAAAQEEQRQQADALPKAPQSGFVFRRRLKPLPQPTAEETERQRHTLQENLQNKHSAQAAAQSAPAPSGGLAGRTGAVGRVAAMERRLEEIEERRRAAAAAAAEVALPPGGWALDASSSEEDEDGDDMVAAAMALEGRAPLPRKEKSSRRLRMHLLRTGERDALLGHGSADAAFDAGAGAGGLRPFPPQFQALPPPPPRPEGREKTLAKEARNIAKHPSLLSTLLSAAEVLQLSQSRLICMHVCMHADMHVMYACVCAQVLAGLEPFLDVLDGTHARIHDATGFLLSFAHRGADACADACTRTRTTDTPCATPAPSPPALARQSTRSHAFRRVRQLTLFFPLSPPRERLQGSRDPSSRASRAASPRSRTCSAGCTSCSSLTRWRRTPSWCATLQRTPQRTP